MGWTRFLQRSQRERERADEIRAHLDLYVDELVAEGLSPEEARRKARLRFGNTRAHLEDVDQMNRLPVFDVLGRDVRFAFRMLRRTPAFSVTAVLTLGVVIGACTAVFSLANAILLQPLPYPDAGRLFMLTRETISSRGQSIAGWHDGATWEAVRDGVPAVDTAVYFAGAGGANLVLGDVATFVSQQRVSAGFFRVLGVAPLIGRELNEDEDLPNGPLATVLGHQLWTTAFAADPNIVGRRILLRGEPYTVVGVMPQSFAGLSAADLWTPLRATTQGEGGGTNFRIIGRLAADTTTDEAEAGLANVSEQAFRLLGMPDGVTHTLRLQSLQEAVTEGTRAPIVMLGAAVLAVLLIACVNLAALLLARGGARTKEIATRMALGAGRRVVLRQLMTESLILAVLGGGLGLVIGQMALAGLQVLGGQTYSEWAGATLDARVLGVTAMLSIATSLVFGLLPAHHAGRVDVRGALVQGGSRSVATGAKPWTRRALVVVEIALGVTLLITAGLLVRTFVNLRGLDPGFEPGNLVTTSVSLQDARYESSTAVNRLFTDSLERLRATPGIEAAAVSLELPYERLLNLGFRFAGETDAEWRIASVTYVTPGYLDALRIPLRRGRALTSADRQSSPPVVLVNEAFARIYSPDRSVVGRRIALSDREREIVGVTGDVQQRAGFTLEGVTPGPLVSAPIVFVPADQTSDAMLTLVHSWFRPVWTVRSSAPGQAGASIRQAIREADPMLPVAAVRSMADVMAAPMREHRLLMILVGLLAGAAVFLAAVGIHGLIAHAVAERRREFGIRIALGAAPMRTVRDVALGGMALALVGAILGGGLSVLAVDLVQAFLWGVGEHDVVTYAAVAFGTLGVAAIASLVPALRILRLNPVAVLRE